MSLQSFRITLLLSWSVIINRFIQFWLKERSIIKLTDISHQIFSETDKDFKNSWWWFFQLLFIQHLSQFQQNLQTSCSILSQKNCQEKSSAMTSLFKWSVMIELWMYWIRLVQRDLESDIHYCSWKSNLSFAFRKHSVIEIFILSIMRNDLHCF